MGRGDHISAEEIALGFLNCLRRRDGLILITIFFNFHFGPERGWSFLVIAPRAEMSIHSFADFGQLFCVGEKCVRMI